MSFTKLKETTLGNIQQINSRFPWKGKLHQKIWTSIYWEKSLKPINGGGLGICNPKTMGKGNYG